MTNDRFVLRATVTSPFGRKVRMAAGVLGLAERITLEPANTLDETDSLRQEKPLGKMPCLLLADGTALYDSRVIIEFLQEAAGSTQLIPARGIARYSALTRAAFADGITEPRC
jgi:glutathione S-transferase